MGGITGSLVLEPGGKAGEHWVRAATGRLAHRGPDGSAWHAEAEVALGCAWLALPGLAGEEQPVASADGRYMIVLDGEIYNNAQLAAALRARGTRLRTGSDAEVLVESFALLGRDVLRKLRGTYAFAIWDAGTRALFCARDPFGVKPLYYAVASQPGVAGAPSEGAGTPVFRFASERKALAGPGELAGLDPAALRRYLALQYVPGPVTATPPLRALMPGHALIVRPGRRITGYRYWRPGLRPAGGPAADTPVRILDVLRESVAAHLGGDAQAGVLLSGGVDSAAVCALAARQRPGLPAVTVGFREPGYSEIGAAQESAAAVGATPVSCLVSAEEFFTELPRVVWHLDDPMADPAAVALWFAAREASSRAQIMLSGDGADELFGGYPAYREPGLVRAGRRLPGWGRYPLRQVAAALPAGRRGRDLLEQAARPLRRRYPGLVHELEPDRADLVAGDSTASAFDVTDPVYDHAAAAGLDDVSAMQLVDISTRLPGDVLVRADRMTVPHGVVLRLPFLDREVMTVASRLSREEKIAGGTTKFAFREALAELLPQAAAERPQRGLRVPVGRWLAGEWAGYADSLLRTAQTGRWINRQAALGILHDFRGGEPGVTWRQVWVLLVFTVWHQIYIEGAYDPVALGWQAPVRAAGPAPG